MFGRQYKSQSVTLSLFFEYSWDVGLNVLCSDCSTESSFKTQNRYKSKLQARIIPWFLHCILVTFATQKWQSSWWIDGSRLIVGHLYLKASIFLFIQKCIVSTQCLKTYSSQVKHKLGIWNVYRSSSRWRRRYKFTNLVIYFNFRNNLLTKK